MKHEISLILTSIASVSSLYNFLCMDDSVTDGCFSIKMILEAAAFSVNVLHIVFQGAEEASRTPLFCDIRDFEMWLLDISGSLSFLDRLLGFLEDKSITS